MSEGTASVGGAPIGGRTGRFFFVVSVLMLVVVFIGFAPTFYLDALFDTPSDARPMPTHLVLHGVFLTTWYAGLVLQSGLIIRRRRNLHQSLGVFGAGIGIGVAITAVLATVNLIPRASALGFPPRAAINGMVTANSMNLLLFTTLLGLAIHNRTKPQAHKRLMLIASIVIIGPAVTANRMFGNYIQSFFPDLFPNLAQVFWVFPVGALVVYDVLSLRRVHPATVWGGGAKAASVPIVLGLVSSGLAGRYVDWLEGFLF